MSFNRRIIKTFRLNKSFIFQNSGLCLKKKKKQLTEEIVPFNFNQFVLCLIKKISKIFHFFKIFKIFNFQVLHRKRQIHKTRKKRSIGLS